MRRALRPGGQLPDWWRMLRRFGPHVRGQPALIAGSVLALVAEIGLRLLEQGPLKIVFDHVLATAPGAGVRLGQRAAIPGLAALEPTTVLALAALGVLVTTGLRAMAAY